jgi:hypothetical protein
LHDRDAFGDPITWVENDLIALPQTGTHFGLLVVPMTYLNRSRLRSSIGDPEDSPFLVLAKKCSHWHGERVTGPNTNMNIHP